MSSPGKYYDEVKNDTSLFTQDAGTVYEKVSSQVEQPSEWANSLLKERSDALLAGTTGVGGDKIAEAIPKYNDCTSDRTINSENGSSIVLGRDRSSDVNSGYGGKGHTQCASIDLVVGRNSCVPNGFLEQSVDMSPRNDAARIYMSQKTDIDDNFGLANGMIGKAVTRSAIAIKADGVRVIAREGIKLVTGVDDNNSQGGANREKFGIELISGNDDSQLQPMVKGINLEELLMKLIDHIDNLNGIVESFMRNQIAIDSVLAAHTHPSLFSPSPEMASTVTATVTEVGLSAYPSLALHKANAAMLKVKYLQAFSQQYINSKFNKTT